MIPDPNQKNQKQWPLIMNDCGFELWSWFQKRPGSNVRTLSHSPTMFLFTTTMYYQFCNEFGSSDPSKKKEKLLVVLTTGQKNCTLMTHVTFLFVYSEMKLRSNSEEDAANSIWPAVEIRKMWESFAEKKLLVDDFEFFIHACSILFCLT